MTELGGVVDIYLGCEGEKDTHLENLISRWKAWESSLVWNQLIPELPFNEDERNYLDSELLDSFSKVKMEGFEYHLNNLFFHFASVDGHLVLAKWLYRIFHQYILQDINYHETFRWICLRGNLQMAEWFLETFPKVDRRFEKSYRLAFYGACEQGHLPVAKLLLERYPNLMQNKAKVLDLADAYGHSEVVEWLNSLKG